MIYILQLFSHISSGQQFISRAHDHTKSTKPRTSPTRSTYGSLPYRTASGHGKPSPASSGSVSLARSPPTSRTSVSRRPTLRTSHASPDRSSSPSTRGRTTTSKPRDGSNEWARSRRVKEVKKALFGQFSDFDPTGVEHKTNWDKARDECPSRRP